MFLRPFVYIKQSERTVLFSVFLPVSNETVHHRNLMWQKLLKFQDIFFRVSKIISLKEKAKTQSGMVVRAGEFCSPQ